MGIKLGMFYTCIYGKIGRCLIKKMILEVYDLVTRGTENFGDRLLPSHIYKYWKSNQGATLAVFYLHCCFAAKFNNRMIWEARWSSGRASDSGQVLTQVAVLYP